MPRSRGYCGSAVFQERESSCPLGVELPGAVDKNVIAPTWEGMGAGRIAGEPVDDERLGFPEGEWLLATSKRPASLLVGRRSGTDTVS